MRSTITSNMQKLKDSVICTLINHLADKKTATKIKNALDPNAELLYGCEEMMAPQTLHIIIPAERVRNPFLVGNRLLLMVQRELPECDGISVNYTTADRVRTALRSGGRGDLRRQTYLLRQGTRTSDRARQRLFCGGEVTVIHK